MSNIVPFNPNKLSKLEKTEKKSPLDTVLRQKNKGENLLQKAHKKGINLIFGIDATASTSDIISSFRKSVHTIVERIAEKANNPLFYFGYFNGEGQKLTDSIETITRCENVAGYNNPDLFLKLVIDKRILSIEQTNVIVLFADGWESGGVNMELICNSLREKETFVFFIYDYDKNAGASRNPRVIKSELIDSMGEKGVLVEGLNNVDIVSLILQITEYAESSKTSNSTQQVSFQKFLESKGGGSTTLQISQGGKNQLKQ